MKNKVLVVASLNCFKAVQLFAIRVISNQMWWITDMFRAICQSERVSGSPGWFVWDTPPKMQFDQDVVKTSFLIWQYSRTPLIRPKLGNKILVAIARWSHYRIWYHYVWVERITRWSYKQGGRKAGFHCTTKDERQSRFSFVDHCISRICILVLLFWFSSVTVLKKCQTNIFVLLSSIKTIDCKCSLSALYWI